VAIESIPSVNDQRSKRRYPSIVNFAVVSHDHNAIGGLQFIVGQHDGRKWRAASFCMGIVKANFPHEWIVVANITTFYSQAINDRERGAFPHIVNVRLVSYPQQQYTRPLH